MRIIIFVDEETGEMWYYILREGEEMPVIIEKHAIGGREDENDEESVH